MKNEILKNMIEKKLQEMSTFNSAKTLYVLKGISLETVDPEHASEASLEKLLENKLGYFFEFTMKKRHFMTYEEFLLLGSFAVEQYDSVIILNNNLFMNQYPLDFSCSEEKIRELLAHFNPEDDEVDQPVIGLNEDLASMFIGLRAYGNGYIGAYCDDRLPQSSKITIVDLFPETERKVPVKEASEGIVDLLEEADYITLAMGLLSGQGNKAIRMTSYAGDITKLNGHLRILAENFGNVYLLQEKAATPTFEHREEYLQILRRYWAKDASFRYVPVYDMAALKEGKKEVVQVSQECIISDIVQQVENCAEKGRDFQDVFVTASTGSGKSAMFQIPAIYLAEKYNLMTIVVSPLISLMNDQIIGLEKRGYMKAKTLNSDISPIVKEEIRQKVAAGEYHILYLSPETLLARSDVEQLIGDRTIGMIVIDEAHIVTTWGKQFRPDYWYLGDHIRRLRKRQMKNKGRSFIISTFTATAIYEGFEDMYHETINSLRMLGPATYLGYMKRDDIDIVIEKSKKDPGSHTEYEPDKFDTIENLVKRATITGKKTLIYFPTVKLIERCYKQLHLHKMTAQVCCYHGSMKRDEKLESYEKFRAGEKLVMFATKAFGMGVDIPDIAIVAHFAPTGNVCDYVQEIGRAARDPKMNGEAYYEYNTHDFKHINTLHGLSKVQNYQLIETMRKIEELYTQNHDKNCNTRKRNAMLLDAENFAYIFQSPLDNQDESINKAKTALLMIQKDFEIKTGWSPIYVRPVPLFEDGYFQVDPAAQKRLNTEFPDCLQEVDAKSHVCLIRLGNIWKADPDCSKHSFPEFKYLLYTRDVKLMLNQRYTLTQAVCVDINFTTHCDNTYEKAIASIKEYVHKKVIDGKFSHMEDIASALENDCPELSRNRAQTICEVILASMETWRQKYFKGLHGAINSQYDNNGKPRYAFSNAIDSYFSWLDKHFRRIRKDTAQNKLYLIDNSGSMIKETSLALGILESLEVLSFKMVGGANSQIYIHINQIRTLQNILKNPDGYTNRLLEAVAERHKTSVKMLTYLFENDFTSAERWDLLEDYFLGVIPEAVQEACRKEAENGKRGKGKKCSR